MTGVFGVSIEEQARKRGGPSVARDLLKYLVAHMAVPELFTCEKSHLVVKKIKLLKLAYQNGRNPLQRGVGLQDPRVVAGLLLEWLSELPEPVIHPSLYAEMLMTQTEATEAEQLNGLQLLLKQLSPASIKVLYPLLEYLHHYIVNTDRHHREECTTKLVCLFTPWLLRRDVPVSSSREADWAAATSAVQMLIKNYRVLFGQAAAAPLPKAGLPLQAENHKHIGGARSSKRFSYNSSNSHACGRSKSEACNIIGSQAARMCDDDDSQCCDTTSTCSNSVATSGPEAMTWEPLPLVADTDSDGCHSSMYSSSADLDTFDDADSWAGHKLLQCNTRVSTDHAMDHGDSDSKVLMAAQSPTASPDALSRALCQVQEDQDVDCVVDCLLGDCTADGLFGSSCGLSASAAEQDWQSHPLQGCPSTTSIDFMRISELESVSSLGPDDRQHSVDLHRSESVDIHRSNSGGMHRSNSAETHNSSRAVELHSSSAPAEMHSLEGVMRHNVAARRSSSSAGLPRSGSHRHLPRSSSSPSFTGSPHTLPEGVKLGSKRVSPAIDVFGDMRKDVSRLRHQHPHLVFA